MRINHNLMAMNTQRQLNIANTNSSKTMEKLSSGQRINRAGDDAAGLAISEKMRGQIRGLNQASRNAQDGISLIQTAEGALTETHAILQRMRELAVQSANSTNNDNDKNEIQNEINQLTSEINRIGNTTEFNTQKLLDGGAESVGKTSNFNVTTSSDLGSTGAATVNEITASAAKQAGVSTIKLDTKLTSGQTLEIAGVTLTEGLTSGLSAVDSVDDQATAIATALNADGTFGTNYTASSTAGVITITEKNANITGADLGAVGGSASGSTTQTQTVDSVQEQAGKYKVTIDTAMADGDSIEIAGQTLTFKADGTGDINPTTDGTATEQAAAIATALASNAHYTVADNGDGTLTLTEKAGQATGSAATANVTGDAATAGVYTFELSENLAKGESITVGNVTLTEGTDFELGDSAANTATAIATALTADATYSATATNGVIQITEATASGNDLTADSISIKASGGEGFNAALQIGANTGQSFNVQIDDMRADALNIATTDNTSESTVEVDGKTYNVAWAKSSDVTNGGANEYALDVTTHDNATAAVKVLDNAINNVSSERSKLGAYQNRLEHTIKNLDTSSENLQAAESRIRDVDMAKEMMEFTKNNILQQASQAMLAQANQAPQGVLQLLR